MIADSKKQAGGTLLGLIIGLIVGLGIAVGVALVITKTSLPFTNKPGNPDRLIQPAPGELTDPNKPLYGKKPESLNPPDAVDGTSPAPAPAVVQDSSKPPVVDKSSSPADKSPSPKSIAADKVEAVKAEAAKAESADEKWIYYLQAGAFRDMGDADSLRAKLALLGIEASVSDRPAETGGTLHRVRIGPFGQAETMNRVRTKLSDNGIDVAVVRIAK